MSEILKRHNANFLSNYVTQISYANFLMWSQNELSFNLLHIFNSFVMVYYDGYNGMPCLYLVNSFLRLQSTRLCGKSDATPLLCSYTGQLHDLPHLVCNYWKVFLAEDILSLKGEIRPAYGWVHLVLFGCSRKNYVVVIHSIAEVILNTFPSLILQYGNFCCRYCLISFTNIKS